MNYKRYLDRLVVAAIVAVILISMHVLGGCATGPEQTIELEQHGSAYRRADISREVAKFAPGWEVLDCGDDMGPGLRAEWGGRKNVLVTYPKSTMTPCVLSKEVDVPSGKRTMLVLCVSQDRDLPADWPQDQELPADWLLVVKVNGKEEFLKLVSKKICTEDGWATLKVDLSPYAGESIKLAMEHHANNWAWESGFWSQIAINSN